MVATAAALAMVATMAVLAAGPVAPAGADEPESWASISAGSHTCGLTTEGAASCWGLDTFGQLGNGPETGVRTSPSPVVTPAGVTWAAIDVATGHTCAVTTDGAGYCWGNNGSRKLGKGGFGNEEVPTLVAAPTDAPDGVTWATISTGADHTCGVTTEGDGYCWGSDHTGRLGNGPTLVADQPAPSPVDTPTGVTWRAISAGTAHTCGVTTDGDGYCWGSDVSGRLGNGPDTTTDQTSPSPIDTPTGVTWATISAGFLHSCGVTIDGDGYCWGSDGDGRLGNGPDTTTDQTSPSPIDTPTGVTWATISPGSLHSCGVTTDGDSYCWGSDANSQLGNGPDTGEQPSPSPIDGPDGAVWATVSAGGAYSCGRTTDGWAHCWGNGASGQLGGGPPGNIEASPTRVGQVQTISFDALVDVILGVPPFEVSAVASSTFVVSFTADGQCTVEGTTVTVTDVGTCTITASQAGDPFWLPAEVAHTFTISAPPNSAPVADAGADQLVNLGDLVTLDGTESTDPDDDELTYTWTQDSGPTVALTDADTAEAAFTAPNGPAVLAFTLTVDDGHDATDTDTVTITVNGPPTADAGEDVVAVEGDEVNLDGTGSSDPDDDELTYTWTQDSGPTVTLTDADTAHPTFTAPPAPATLVITLTVDDGRGRTTTDTVTVAVRFTPDRAFVNHLYEVLLGRSVDPDGLTYWTGRLDSGTSRTIVADQVGHSAEALRGRVLDQRYGDWLGRTADPDARAYWGDRLQAGVPLATVEVELLASTELYGQGGATNAGYVTLLYQRVLGRTPDADGLAFHRGRLDRGTPRRAVADTILHSPEAQRRRVARAYHDMLGRPADPDGLDFWSARLDRTHDLLAIEIALAAAWTD